MFHLKNLTNPKKFSREYNVYVRIPNFLTSWNFEKFLRWKFICSFFPFPVTYNLFFLLESRKKKLKDRHFRKENSFFRFENCGNFSGNSRKFNALGPSIPLEENAYKFSARFLKNSLKMHLPKKIISPKMWLSRKKFYPEKWVFPENCVIIKKKSLSRKTCPSRKMFHLKKLTTPKKLLRECNIYVKILNFLTSENFGKFLRWKPYVVLFHFL